MRVGILGLGSIGLRHARNAKHLGHEVLGFDPDEGRQHLLHTYGGMPTTRDAAYACDRLVIATPTPEHWRDVSQARCPTLLEKPLCDRPLDELDLSHISLVGYNLRYHSCVRQTKSWLKTGQIGTPLNATFLLAQFNDKPAYLRDGVVLNWSHEIDLALHLLGSGSLLSSVNKNNTVADLFIAHQTGAVSTIHLNYLNKKEVREFTILGDQGKIHCVLAPYRQATCDAAYGGIYSYTYDTTFDGDYIEEMKAFLSGDIGPGCTALEAKEVLDICLGGL